MTMQAEGDGILDVSRGQPVLGAVRSALPAGVVSGDWSFLQLDPTTGRLRVDMAAAEAASTTWIKDVNLGITVESNWMDATPFIGGALWLFLQWLGTLTPNGVFTVQGCSLLATAGDLTSAGLDVSTIDFDARKVHGNVGGSNYSHTEGTNIAVNSAVAGYLQIPIVRPMPYHKVVWTRTNGGVANALQGQYKGVAI